MFASTILIPDTSLGGDNRRLSKLLRNYVDFILATCPAVSEISDSQSGGLVDESREIIIQVHGSQHYLKLKSYWNGSNPYYVSDKLNVTYRSISLIC
jgi:hypothetical protein